MQTACIAYHAAKHSTKPTHARKPSMKPNVSIIIPIYNVKPFLEQCLESVLAQDMPEIEVVCVDDGSTDGSSDIIDRFAARDERIVAVHKENGGYGKAVNRGLEHATADYIGIVEPDDYVDPAMYRTLWNAAQRHRCPDVVKAAYWRVCAAGTEEEHMLPANYLHCVSKVDEPFQLAEDAEFLFHHPSIWSAIYRRSFLDEHHIRMHEIPGAGWADNPFLMETLAEARTIVYVDEPLYFYREFNVNSSSNVKDPSIIYDRWLDMDDIVKAQHITAPRILEGHYNRGCAYLEMLNDDFDVEDPEIKRNIKAMVARIDYNAVIASQKIPQNYKDAYQRHVSAPARLAHKISRVFK